MAVEVIRTMASRRLRIVGSGTFSTESLRGGTPDERFHRELPDRGKVPVEKREISQLQPLCPACPRNSHGESRCAEPSPPSAGSGRRALHRGMRAHRSFALRDRGFRAISSAVAVTGSGETSA